jgi:hypothetical protein
MKGLVALSLVAAVALTGCSKPKPVLILDGWWSGTFAKRTCAPAKQWLENNRAFVAQVGCDKTKSCPEMTALQAACGDDPAAKARAFEDQFAAAFAVNCPKIGFERLDDPNHQITTPAELRWRLMIDFTPATQQQVWTLTGPSSQYERSSGAAPEVAAKVCAAMQG